MIRIGQIGVGYWGKNLLRNLLSMDGVRVSSICDADPSTLHRLSKELHEIKLVSAPEELFKDDQLDAIVIATESQTHASLAQRALESGKHVFVEKPLALTSIEAHELRNIVHRKGLILMVGHILEYHPAYEYVEELIGRGEIGDVYYLYSTRVNLGIFREKENALWSLAPHDVSVALRFIKEKPVAVSATGRSYLRNGIEDVAFLEIEFEHNKMAHLHVSWLDPHKIRQMTVVGSTKMVVIDDMESAEKVRIYDKGVNGPKTYETYGEAMSIRNGDVHIPYIPMKEPLRLELEHFVRCVETGAQPKSNVESGLAVVKILEAASRSLKEHGKPMEIL